MSDLRIEDAQREQVKLRLSISSPTGFGKTWSALLIALGMTGGNPRKIGVIDTENRSASLYAPDLGKFKVINLGPPFSAERYMQAMNMFIDDPEIEVIIGDSITHVWKGTGGLLEHNDSLGGRFSDWAKTTPIYMRWLNTILQSPKHMIQTMRKKQAYAQSVDESTGKKKVEKLGLEDEIRGGFDYEMTVAFEVINDKHMAYTSKDRTNLFVGKPEFLITRETGKLLLDWCELGIVAAEHNDSREPLTATHPKWMDAIKFVTEAGGTVEKLRVRYKMAPEIEQTLLALKTAYVPAGQPTTQQQIHQQNANYVPPQRQNSGSPAASSEGTATVTTQPPDTRAIPILDDRPF